MQKWWIIGGLLVAGLVGGGVLVVAPKFMEKPSTQTKADVASASQEVRDATPSAGTSNNYAQLQEQVASMQAQISTLETQVKQLQKGSKTGVQQSTSQAKLPPQFIPLGVSSNTPSGTTTWQTLPTPVVTINAASYPGYLSMQLQMNLLVFQGNGTAYARLVDVNSGVVVPFSDVSSSSYDYQFVRSAAFQLFPGVHTYGIQVMTTTGYPVQFTDARIQVNFTQ